MSRKKSIGYEIIIVLLLTSCSTTEFDNSWSELGFEKELLEINYPYASFDYVLPGELETLYQDSFANNTGQWYENTDSDDFEAEIEDGVYTLSNREDGVFYFISKDLGLDTSRDFQICAEFQIPSGVFVSDKGCGIALGQEEDVLYFFYTKGRTISIGEYKDQAHHSMYREISSDRIKLVTGYHHLCVRKVDDLYFFFFEEELIHHSPSFAYGEKIGFYIGSKIRCHVDNLEVNYIHQR